MTFSYTIFVKQVIYVPIEKETGLYSPRTLEFVLHTPLNISYNISLILL
jgi:hypothetical protein